jgi:ADP-heptose:LPS heptosyltransferase
LIAKSILLVKTSSLGDVIHALPAISDSTEFFGRAAGEWCTD